MGQRALAGQAHLTRTPTFSLTDISAGLHGWPAVLVAHELRLFPLLAERSRTVHEVSESLKIPRRSAEALLSITASIGFVARHEDQYSLTPVAEDYLLPNSPGYFGSYLDLMVQNHSTFSFENIRNAVLTGEPQAYGGSEIFKAHAEQAEAALAFTRGMHGVSMGPARAWPEVIDLARHRLMLDVGGGSGAHSIGALLKWPHLRAVILDLACVCKIGHEIAAQYGVQERIQTDTADFWNDPYPQADLHFYGMIYHDWPPEKCSLLTRKSFDSLPSGGRIIIHEKLFNDDKTGPFSVAAENVAMLVWVQGQEFSGLELSEMLIKAGFGQVEVKPTLGYWGIVTGLKP